MDDGSTDRTWEAIQGATKVFHQRFQAIRGTPGQAEGPAYARNAGIKQARGEFIAFLDSDDQWVPEHLARAYHCFQAYGERFGFFAGPGQIMGTTRFLHEFPWPSPEPQSASPQLCGNVTFRWRRSASAVACWNKWEASARSWSVTRIGCFICCYRSSRFCTLAQCRMPGPASGGKRQRVRIQNVQSNVSGPSEGLLDRRGLRSVEPQRTTKYARTLHPGPGKRVGGLPLQLRRRPDLVGHEWSLAERVAGQKHMDADSVARFFPVHKARLAQGNPC